MPRSSSRAWRKPNRKLKEVVSTVETFREFNVSDSGMATCSVSTHEAAVARSGKFPTVGLNLPSKGAMLQYRSCGYLGQIAWGVSGHRCPACVSKRWSDEKQDNMIRRGGPRSRPKANQFSERTASSISVEWHHLILDARPTRLSLQGSSNFTRAK